MKKIALITGASKGLGFETALQLGKKGFTVIVTARTQHKSNEAAAKLKTKDIEVA
jgi:short-subunit dehydrogenase